MDTQIAVLPPHVIDQIAAGEVIERPASVVKELVDNALDAGAGTISVETSAGGRTLIRVVDDGCGMSPHDAVLAFERHATSKLQRAEQLWELATMGFRGEALPSIASAARVTLTTRRQADLSATRVEIEGGKVVAVGEVGAPVGTTVEVADLFFNVPARLKFLKSESTEASHVTELIARLAMARPQLHLRLRHNGRIALDVPPDRDGFSRAQALLGPRVASRMIAVSGQESGIRVVAYLGAPELAQSTARGVQLFVGKRPVRDRGLLHAIAMGYGELVPRGRYPLAVVALDAPAGSVDYNVHPQKQEVRFSDPGAVAAAVRHVVQAGIARASWRDEIGGAGPVTMPAIASVAPPRLPLDGPATSLAQTYAAQLREARERPQGRLGFDDGPRQWAMEIRERNRSARAAEAEVAARAAYAIARAERRAGDATRRADTSRAVPGGGAGEHGTFAAPSGGARSNGGARDGTELPGVQPALFDIATAAVAEGAAPVAAEPSAAPWDGVQLAEGSAPQATAGYFASLRYLGQLDLTYLVCEGDGELVLIDQHVAHERVEFTRLKAGQGTRDVATQHLLFPTTIEVKPAQLALATELADVLAQVGYEAEAFGRTTLALKAVPGGIRHGDPALLLRKLLDEWSADGERSGATSRPSAPPPRDADVGDRARGALDRVLAEIACHSVVRAGDRLSPNEAEALLRSMDDADFTARGLHDRPVMLRLSLADIARRFGR